MFGLHFVKRSEIKELKETMNVYRRQLEDIGWTNMIQDPSETFQGVHLQDIIKRARSYYDNNPLAGHWVDLTTAFIFGEGLSTPKAKDEKIQEVIDGFWSDLDNQKVLTTFLPQQLICNKLQYEGNLFFLLFDDEEGNVKVRMLNTLDVVDVIKDPEDNMRVLFYKIAVRQRGYNFGSDSYNVSGVKYLYYPDIDNYDINEYKIPASKLITEARIMHVKVNCDINSKFGIPLLHRGIDWMKAHKDMAGDLATLIKALSQFAWKKKVKGSQSQLNTLKNALTSRLDLSNLRNSVGRTQLENQGVDLQSIDVKTGGVKVGAEGLHQMKLMIAAASHISETYYGDASNSNLATSRSLELPMFKIFTSYQCTWIAIYDAILQYQINKKIEVGLLPGMVTQNEKTKRTIYETDIDRHVDIDFPPLTESDLKNWADALGGAKTNGLVHEELAARLFMLAANVNNIDEEIKRLFEEKEDDSKKKPVVSPVVKPEDIKESIEAPNRVAEARLAKKSNYVIQRMNGYTKALRTHFTALKKEIREASKTAGTPGLIVGNVPNLDGILSHFQEGMRASAKVYFPVAVQIGEKFAQATLKTYNVDIKETIYEAQGKATDVLRESIAWNDQYVATSLIPDMEKSLMEGIRQSYETTDDFKRTMIDSVGKFESRVEQYAGAFWHVEEKAVKEAIAGTGLLANFAGAYDSSTCEECAAAVDGNPYSVDSVPVPGEFKCNGRCRHVIQIINQ